MRELYAVWLSGAYSLAIAWIIVFFIWPFFSVLRPILEHRDDKAMVSVDYVTHGPVTRIFEDGPIANTLGGAGLTGTCYIAGNLEFLHAIKGPESYLRDTNLVFCFRGRNNIY